MKGLCKRVHTVGHRLKFKIDLSVSKQKETLLPLTSNKNKRDQYLFQSLTKRSSHTLISGSFHSSRVVLRQLSCAVSGGQRCDLRHTERITSPPSGEVLSQHPLLHAVCSLGVSGSRSLFQDHMKLVGGTEETEVLTCRSLIKP